MRGLLIITAVFIHGVAVLYITPCLLLLAGPAKCLHFLPNGVSIASAAIPWSQGTAWSVQGRTRDTNGDFMITSFPDGCNHFLSCSPCVGQIAQGKSCDYKFMMHCAFCPETRFKLLNDGKYVSWTNPIACRTPYDMVRDCKAHVHALRGWHMFWYAVYTLARLLPGLGDGGAAGAAGGGVVVDAEHVEQCRLWLQNKAPDWYSNRGDFERAGLLVDGGEGEAYGLPVKFRKADALLDKYSLRSLPKTTKKRNNTERSREVTPIIACAAEEDLDSGNSELDGHGAKRVKFELSVGDISWNAVAGASQHHSLPLPPNALGSSSDAVLAAYNFAGIMSEREINGFFSQDPFSDAGAAGPPDVFSSQTPDPRTLERHDFVAAPPPIYDSDIDGPRLMDSVQPAAGQLNVGGVASGGVVDDGGGLPMHSEQHNALQDYAPHGTYADHRPVVNLLLDAMSSVGFDTQVVYFHFYIVFM